MTFREQSNRYKGLHSNKNVRVLASDQRNVDRKSFH